MALSVSTQVSPVASKLAVQTSATSTADADVFGGAATIFMVDVDNALNPAQDVYLKLWNDAGPTVGTTPPDFIFFLPQGVRRQLVLTEGLAFDTAVSFACVTVGGTTGTTSPTAAVVVRVVAN